MEFTHAAFFVYSVFTTSDGRQLSGYAVYNLYQYGDRPDVSHLVQDYPVDFFAGAAVLDAGLIIPSAELQRRLLRIFEAKTYAAVHVPAYSVIANPFTLERQNCTEFVLDVINAAIYQTTNKILLKNAAKAYFTAQSVDVSPFKLMLGAMFSAELTLKDQSGPPVTATFETIRSYLLKYDTGAETMRVLP